MVIVISLVWQANAFAGLHPKEVLEVPAFQDNTGYERYLGTRPLLLLSDDGQTLFVGRGSFRVFDVTSGAVVSSDLVKGGARQTRPPTFITRSVSQFAHSPLPTNQFENAGCGLLAAADRNHLFVAASMGSSKTAPMLGGSIVDLTRRGQNPNLDRLLVAKKASVDFRVDSGCFTSRSSGKISVNREWADDRRSMRCVIYRFDRSGIKKLGTRSMAVPSTFKHGFITYDLAADMFISLGATEIAWARGNGRTHLVKLPWTPRPNPAPGSRSDAMAWPVNGGIVVTTLNVTVSSSGTMSGTDAMYFLRKDGRWLTIGPYAIAARSQNGRHLIIGDRANKKQWLVSF